MRSTSCAASAGVIETAVRGALAWAARMANEMKREDAPNCPTPIRLTLAGLADRNLSGCGIGTATRLLELLRAATPHNQTCSVGVAVWTFGEGPADLVARADAALYEAKRRGRDRLIVAKAPISDPEPARDDG